jgi:DNA polymerase
MTDRDLFDLPVKEFTSLAELEDHIKKFRCARCSHARVVFGDGNPQAKLVFIGEAPGEEEDRQGIPFVGKSGMLLNKMLHSINLTREEVYICNAIKCRPPNNKTPTQAEINACNPFLVAQLKLLKPKIICTLGSPALKALLGIKESITKIRGKWLKYEALNADVLPTFHPAYLLRDPSKKRQAWEDFQMLAQKYRSIQVEGSTF